MNDYALDKHQRVPNLMNDYALDKRQRVPNEPHTSLIYEVSDEALETAAGATVGLATGQQTCAPQIPPC